jgi:hypothetical protein
MSGLSGTGQFRHGHHVHHHTGPAGKVLCPLAIARVRVVLFPSESSSLPLAEDILDQILPQIGIHLPRLFLVRTGNRCSVLWGFCQILRAIKSKDGKALT